MGKRKFKLSTIIITFVCLVVLLSLLITDFLVSRTVTETIRNNQEEKAKIVSRTVAKSIIVQNALEDKHVNVDAIQDYTMDIQQAANVMFVVVMDMEGIRKSHPDPTLIGKRFKGGDEGYVLDGKEHISISEGTLGKSLRAFTPIFRSDGEQIGAVAVGISLSSVEEALGQGHRTIIIGSIIGILAGILGAIILARYIKKILFGLEPFAIAKIHQERNTMLQSVHEGVLAVDRQGVITLINKSALEIFQYTGLSKNPVGMKISEFLPTSNLERVLETGKAEHDVELTINGVSILVNRASLIVNEQVVGAISTFRDKTEVNRLAEQLTGVKMYADALRAQSHEFMNRLHVILGMVKMNYHEELEQYITQLVDHQNHEAQQVIKNIKDPALAGFLMGKLSFARENKVEMIIQSDTIIPESQETKTTHELITIIGNLIDNAIDAMCDLDEKYVKVLLDYEQDILEIRVRDYGTGISLQQFPKLFEKGFSTKGENRGYGLYLVKNSIDQLGGSLQLNVRIKKGTEFIIQIPYITKENKS